MTETTDRIEKQIEVNALLHGFSSRTKRVGMDECWPWLPSGCTGCLADAAGCDDVGIA